jgi:hypothetical protein
VDVTFFWQQKTSNQRKLPAARYSMKGCTLAVSVVAEQNKAGFLGIC